jgi:hypothetical protein
MAKHRRHKTLIIDGWRVNFMSLRAGVSASSRGVVFNGGEQESASVDVPLNKAQERHNSMAKSWPRKGRSKTDCS